jgi:hypothetical protein
VKQSTLALTIDLDAEKVVVGSWGASPVMGKPADTLTFGKDLAPQYGKPTGSLNRIKRPLAVVALVPVPVVLQMKRSVAEKGTTIGHE